MGEGAARKVTYSLPDTLLNKMETAVREGAAPSYSAFVAQAIQDQLHTQKEQRIKEAFAAAGEDPLFLEDVEETMRAFGTADREIDVKDQT
jgi:Arc/MetJ-type ribon-helix-helix transcriptional regulator